jgi:glycosyltransferase involved in cell wall biosynthesis
MKSSFITWLPYCRRSDSLAAALGGKSHLIHYLGFKRPWQAPFKYILQLLATLVRLYRDKPELILVATPPVLAALPVYAYARLRRAPFVIDAHTGVFDNRRWTWLLPLSRWLSRAATATIVTNEHLAKVVRSWGAPVVTIGPLPVIFPPIQAALSRDGVDVLVINTFSDDEPLEVVIEAARKAPNVALHITGDVRRAPRGLQAAAPPNVHFLGWLSEEEYVSHLNAATVVMVLTTRDHTMQRGAYEAMALEKPLITSNWPLLRQTFNKGTIHVENTASAIAAAIEIAIRDHKRLGIEMKELRHENDIEFKVKLNKLLEIIKIGHAQ